MRADGPKRCSILNVNGTVAVSLACSTGPAKVIPGSVPLVTTPRPSAASRPTASDSWLRTLLETLGGKKRRTSPHILRRRSSASTTPAGVFIETLKISAVSVFAESAMGGGWNPRSNRTNGVATKRPPCVTFVQKYQCVITPTVKTSVRPSAHTLSHTDAFRAPTDGFDLPHTHSHTIFHSRERGDGTRGQPVPRLRKHVDQKACFSVSPRFSFNNGGRDCCQGSG